jgi:hypothetical protein
MVAKLSTTISKIQSLPNSSNSITLNLFLLTLKEKFYQIFLKPKIKVQHQMYCQQL